MSTLTRYVLPLLILLAAGLGAFAIFVSKPAPERRAPEFKPPLVRVHKVELQDVQLTIRSQGTVAPRTESRLVPEVSGRVLRVSPAFVVGGFFEAGDSLLEIDPYDYRQALVQARSRVAQARLRLAQEEAEAEVARREWVELGSGEATPLTLRQLQLEDAHAALQAASAGVEQAQRDLERTVVKAPYAGRVRDKRVDVGQYVTRGTAVATLYSVDAAEVRLPLPDSELAYLDLPLNYRGEDADRRGPEVTLQAEFGGTVHRWVGRVVRTEGEIDPSSRMVHVVAQVKDPYGRDGDRPPLAVGMFVEAELRGHIARDVAVLPRGALHPGDVVWTVDEEGRLHFREVHVFRTQGDQVLISSGLEQGEWVCLSSLEAATEGMRVRIAAEGGDGEGMQLSEVSADTP